MKIVIGGTFSRIHFGHIKLLTKAFEMGDKVCIGLTSDSYVKKHKIVPVYPYSIRKKNLVKVINEMRPGKKYSIVMIDDKYGPSVSQDFDIIVVSPETKPTAININSIRRKNGLKPLRIVTIRRVLAYDGNPISSTRISKGEIDSSGKKISREKSGTKTHRPLAKP